MNINAVVDYLNKVNGYDVPTSYYAYIQEWEDWWKGYYKPFHDFTETGYSGKTKKRQIYSLKMAKKVCEDWASILLNEKTEIVVDKNKNNKFVDSVFELNNFWQAANELIEKTFYSGTGAFVLRFENLKLVGEKAIGDKNTEIRIEFLNALNIIPLSIKYGNIVDVAFVSDVMLGGKNYVYVETHILTDAGYEITNRYFKEDAGSLNPIPLPEGMIEGFSTQSDIPLFSIMKPNIVNTIDGANGLGMSVFANSIDNLQGVDLCYNNFNRDFKLGGKKVFINDSLVTTTESGEKITPDDTAQQLFIQFGDDFLDKNGGNKLIKEFNPSLRVQENIDGLQAQLDYLSFKCGFGTKHYQFNAGAIITATQYVGDKQELMQNASKNYIVVERSLKTLVRSIMWAGKNICGIVLDEDPEIKVIFDDSYIVDKESELLAMQQDVASGLIKPEIYIAKKYGVTKEEALKMMPAASSLFETNPLDTASTEGAPKASTSEVVDTVEDVAGKSLNGAQTQSLIAILSQYAAGELTIGQAINVISVAIGISKEEAKKIIEGAE